MQPRHPRLLVALACGLACGLAACSSDPDGDPSDAGPGEPDLFVASDCACADARLPEADLGPTDPADQGSPATDAAPPDLGPPAPDEGPPPAGCHLGGRVLGSGPTPGLPGVRLVLCDDQHCFTDTSDDEGYYSFDDLAPLDLALKVLGASVAYSSVTLPALRCEGAPLELEPVTLQPLPAGTLIGADQGGDLQADPNLSLQIPAGLLYPNFEDEAEISAQRVGPDSAPARVLAGRELVAAWSFAPYGTTSAAGVSFVVSLGLEPGRSVDLAALDHVTGLLLPLGSAEVDAAGRIHSSAAAPLPELSWLLVLEPSAADSKEALQ